MSITVIVTTASSSFITMSVVISICTNLTVIDSVTLKTGSMGFGAPKP